MERSIKPPMNPFKSIMVVGIVAFVSIISTAMQAEERLNSRQAVKLCKQEITATYADNNKIKFSKNPASSVKSDAFKFWINSTERSDGNKTSVRYLCEVTRAGELVGLTRESGRWKI